jgi:hypothetical protein
MNEVADAMTLLAFDGQGGEVLVPKEPSARAIAAITVLTLSAALFLAYVLSAEHTRSMMLPLPAVRSKRYSRKAFTSSS